MFLKLLYFYCVVSIILQREKNQVVTKQSYYLLWDRLVHPRPQAAFSLFFKMASDAILKKREKVNGEFVFSFWRETRNHVFFR